MRAAPPFVAALLLSLAVPAAGVQPLDADAARAIDALFADVDRADGPGCALGVSRAGALAMARGYGMANLDWGIPITPATNFYLGSVSKQFTAGAIALAARQGRLSLDDDIREHVPEVPDYGETITIRHLVHHTSGLRDYLELGAMSGRRLEDVWGRDEILALIGRQEGLNFPPGERYLYSNTGYFLLAEIVERATGLSLREFAQTHIFGPLEMTSTRFHDDHREVLPLRAVGYEEADGEWRMNHAWSFDQVGSGGVYSSIEDLARWDADYYRESVGGRGFRDQMLERGVLEDGEVLDYAFGLDVGRYRGLPTVAHGGSLAGFRSQLLRFPEERTAVVVLCNFPTAEPGRRARRVADVLLAGRLGEAEAPEAANQPGVSASGEGTDGSPTPELQAAERDRYLGTYYSRELEVAFRVEADGKAIRLVGPRGDSVALGFREADTFATGPVRLRFERDAGAVTGFTLDGGRARGIRFVRRP